MARSEIVLSVRSATLTDDSSGSEIAEIVRVVTTDTSNPKLAQFLAKFDDTTMEYLFWQFRLPGHFRSSQESGFPKLHIQFFMASDQVSDDKTVAFEAAVLAVTPRDASGSPAGDDDEMTSLDMTADGGGWVIGSLTLDHADPATNDRLYEMSLDLSSNMDGATDGDYMVVALRRAATQVVLDTAIGDACVVAVSLDYTVR